MRGRRFAKGLKFAGLALIAVSVFGLVVMQLWNWLIPAMFGLHAISFVQALGLLVLSKILFGGFRGRGDWHGRHWRHRMAERYEHMTMEEREKFRQGMRPGCQTQGERSMSV